MDEYITLTSNDYSTFNFSYKLSKQFILKENKEYECALIDIITDNITIPDLGCVLYYDGFIIHTIRLIASNGETFFSIINKINKSLKSIDSISSDMNFSKIDYNFENNSLRHVLKNKLCYISYSGQITNILNLEQTDVFNYGNNKTVYLENKQLHSLNSLFIFTNLIEFQYINEKMDQLLSVVSIRRDSVKEKIKTPIYKKILNKIIDEICIDIRDDLSKEISFFQGKLTLILHIREKF